MIQNYTVLWDTSKTLLISEFLYLLQVLGCLTVWSCLENPLRMCNVWCWSTDVPRSHSFVPGAFCDTCPEPSAAWPALAESPEMQLGQNCTSADVMNVSPPWFLQLAHSTPWEEWAGPGQGWEHPLVSVQQEVLIIMGSASAAFHPWIWSSALLHWFWVFRWTCVQWFLGAELAANRAQSQQYTKWILKAKITC